MIQKSYFDSIYVASSVAAVIYCAALDEFDMVCPEEPTKNKMEESLEVFEKVRHRMRRLVATTCNKKLTPMFCFAIPID